MINFYHNLLPNLATISEPLRKLTRKDEKFSWTENCDNSFKKLKSILKNQIETYIYDPNKPTILSTDASDCGIGAVLSQIQNTNEVPIAFASTTLQPH